MPCMPRGINLKSGESTSSACDGIFHSGERRAMAGNHPLNFESLELVEAGLYQIECVLPSSSGKTTPNPFSHSASAETKMRRAG